MQVVREALEPCLRMVESSITKNCPGISSRYYTCSLLTHQGRIFPLPMDRQETQSHSASQLPRCSCCNEWSDNACEQ